MIEISKMPIEENIIKKIYHFRGLKVMLDSDLADLYKVETKQLKRQVKRNQIRFPNDFMFELSDDEQKILRCQIGTLGHGTYSKYRTMAFTEQGVAMLSSVLNSEGAILVNIEIIRIFTKIRSTIAQNESIRQEIERIKNRLDNQDKNLEVVFKYLDELTSPIVHEQMPRKRIGFLSDII